MKICLVLFADVLYSPYANFYIDFLTKHNIDFDVIFLNRDSKIRTKYPSNYFCFKKNNNNKIITCLRYISFVKKTIKKNGYNRLIIFTSTLSVLLNNFLTIKFKRKYIVDIRDYTFENLFIFKFFEKRVLKNSYANVISSKYFSKFLPKFNYKISHNIDFGLKTIQSTNCDHITIGYVGSISYADEVLPLIDLVRKDNRFSFYFYGNDSTGGLIENYINKINCDRIKFFGRFNYSEKTNIYKNIDIIFNCYGNKTNLVKYALSNKLYDGIILCKPLLTSPDTAMSFELDKFTYSSCFGEETDLNALYDWFVGFDFSLYRQFCKSKLLEIEHDIDSLNETLIDFIYGKDKK